MHFNDLNLNVSSGTHLAECRKKTQNMQTSD